AVAVGGDLKAGETIGGRDHAVVEPAKNAIGSCAEDGSAVREQQAAGEFELLGEGEGCAAVNGGASTDEQLAGSEAEGAGGIGYGPALGIEHGGGVSFVEQGVAELRKGLARQVEIERDAIAEEIVFAPQARFDLADGNDLVSGDVRALEVKAVR